MRIGILHPGEMGISVAASAQREGRQVLWASDGRGPATRARAEQHGLRDAGTLAALCAECALIVSVCPPHAADDVARQVVEAAFAGLFVDANAIAPQRAARMAQAMEAAGIGFVDGGIVGGPAWAAGQTWLYLSGARAHEAAACFEGGLLETQVLGDAVGDASALKMCYAALNKGNSALLVAVLAAAEQLGVRDALNAQWERDEAGSAARAEMRARRVTAKAWRFAGEMDEIADAFRQVGVPGEFHAAAGALYRRLAGFKDAAVLPEAEEVLRAAAGDEG